MEQIHLVCLPFAGAGASFFHPWRTEAPSGVQVVAPQLPGREWRVDEEPYLDAGRAVDAIVPEVLAAVAGSGPVVLFGHSLGALLAFELAAALTEDGRTAVDHLVVSGAPGPWTRRARRATGLDDEAFVERVREFAGYTHEAFAVPEMRELILPALRADVAMHENYVPRVDRPLDVPITAVRGRTDELVSTVDAREWAAATTRDFVLVEVTGGHMYLVDGAHHVLDLVKGVATGV